MRKAIVIGGGIIVAIGALIGGLYAVFQWGLTVGEKNTHNTHVTEQRSTAFTGYFRDIKANGDSYTGKEGITLTFAALTDSPGVESVSGVAKGEVFNEQNNIRIRASTTACSGRRSARPMTPGVRRRMATIRVRLDSEDQMKRVTGTKV